jgi:hypothetical protein
MKIIDLSFCLIVIFTTVIGVEAPEIGMKKINYEQDLKPFAGKIVVFRFNDNRVASSTCRAACNLNTQLKFGSVHETFHGITFIGYQLIQIVEKGIYGFWDVIRAEHTQKGLLIRDAHDEELVTLHESIATKQDKFVYINRPEQGLKVIENQSGFEFEKKEKLR